MAWVASLLSSAGGAAASGASAVGGAAASGASALGSAASTAGGALSSGAQAVGGAVEGASSMMGEAGNAILGEGNVDAMKSIDSMGKKEPVKGADPGTIKSGFNQSNTGTLKGLSNFDHRQNKDSKLSNPVF
jgi:hypothetical protein